MSPVLLVKALPCLKFSAWHIWMQVPFNHIAMVQEAQLLVLANSRWEAIYVVHLDASCARFDALTEFRGTMPVFSIAALCEASRPVIDLYCIQTEVRSGR